MGERPHGGELLRTDELRRGDDGGAWPMLTPSENSRSSGTSAICSGTICSAKIPMKTQLLPRNGIHADGVRRERPRERQREQAPSGR